MSSSTFKEFIEKRKAEEEGIDWESRKQDYLEKVKQLMETIRGYLDEFSDSLPLTEEKKTIYEDYLGEYDVPVLHIDLYGKRASVIPVGRNIIGTPGRVDLVSLARTVRIILADKKRKRFPERTPEELIKEPTDYVWKIVTDPPRIRFITLDKERFLDALQEVLGG